MDNTTDFPGKQTSNSSTLAGDVERRSVHTRRNVAIMLWLIGFIALVVASVMVFLHPAPWPFDLQTTITLQHLQLPSWVISPIGWPTTVNDPIPQVSSLILWFSALSEPQQTGQSVALSLDLDPIPALRSAEYSLHRLFAGV